MRSTRRITLSVLACSLSVLLATSAASAATSSTVTFNKDIAPVIWKNCTGCHRTGEVGPFPLISYQDAAKRADFLADITSERRMPPWKAEPNYGSFHDARILSQAEIDLFAAWAKAGALEGNPKDLPKMPTYPEGWQLGKPDVVLKMTESFMIPASGRDIYRCFVLPIPMDENQTVAAVEFRPGNPRIVHHAIFYLDSNGAARTRDGEDGKPGYASFGGPGILPTGGLGGWAPGMTPHRLPEGIGKFLRKGSDLVMQIHYHPNGKEETDQSTVGIYFTEKPAEKLVVGVAMRSRRLNIPAGESRYEVTAESAKLPCDVEGLTIFPHMHMLGKEMKVWAESPDGSETPLIWIKDWDFNWQGAYFYDSPVKLAKGTVLKLKAAYDNSADNPRNPNNPPKNVHWGEQTTDEMCLCSVSVVTNSLSDLRQIATMRGNELGVIIDGGIAGEDLEEESAKKFAKLVPAEGLPIPERFQKALAPFDKDSDGRLTVAEVDAMPSFVRYRVRQAVLERLGE
jgi:hypothetical protein